MPEQDFHANYTETIGLLIWPQISQRKYRKTEYYPSDEALSGKCMNGIQGPLSIPDNSDTMYDCSNSVVDSVGNLITDCEPTEDDLSQVDGP